MSFDAIYYVGVLGALGDVSVLGALGDAGVIYIGDVGVLRRHG